MKSPIVLLHTDAPDEAFEVLSQNHGGLRIHVCENYEDIPQVLRNTRAEVVYSVRFAGTPAFPREAILNAPSVKWISVGGSGTDHLAPWDISKTVVTNSAGTGSDMMAQYALGAMLNFSLDFPGFRAAQKRREWLIGKVEPIDGKTVLILGLGGTGKAVAKRCKAQGLSTIGVRARPCPAVNVDEVHGTDALPGLWGKADFIVVCVPLLDGTRGLVGAEAFAEMKKGAVLIDVSRGGVVDESALLHALNSRKIRGAAIDVFTSEPLPPDHPLWGCENAILTPHCSSVHDGWYRESAEMFSANLMRYRKGEELENIVDPSRGY
ncbi:MAG: D-2-hydroxyacid dehydrogenase [Roseovarius sp.]|nr:D-2-hydroxyacid dehydrogenase [Roseovarius sp.]